MWEDLWHIIFFVLMIFMANKLIKNHAEETQQTIINVGIALGLTPEEAQQILLKNKEKD